MNEGPNRTVRKPISFLVKPMRADFKGLFVSLTKAVATGVTFQWDKAAGEMAAAITAIGLESDPEGLAWLLVRRAMTKALFDLAGQSADLLSEAKLDTSASDPDVLAAELDRKLEAMELPLDTKLFTQPEGLPIVGAMRETLRIWTQAWGLRREKAESLAGRLPAYFVYHLSEEWRVRAREYAAIQNSLATPFTPAEERERQWASYAGYLQRMVDQSMLGEPFSLRQLYIPLRGYFERQERQKVSESSDKDKREHFVVDLADAIDAWLDQARRDDAIRVVSGGPGSGKSSFAKIYAAQRARRREFPVIYVPLHQFDVKGDLPESLDEFCKMYEMLPTGTLDAKDGEKRLLVVFDGLDELSKQGKAAFESAQQFLHQVERAVDTRNAQHLRLQVLIMGRPVAVQAHEGEFRKEGQVIHLLGYHLSKRELAGRDYADLGNLLKVDQRNQWWQKLGAVSGDGYNGLPKELQREDLHDVTAQPLLNYLVALSYRRGKVNFEKMAHLNALYADLLEAVYARAYEKRPLVKELTFLQFVRVLEEIALAAWHGNGRTTTIKAIQQHCRSSGVAKYLEKFQEGAQAGVARLLTAFYFRRSDSAAEDPTFEFTHKSFGEYLIACRIANHVKLMHESLQERERDLEKGWDEPTALTSLAIACGPTPLDGDIIVFLQPQLVQVAESKSMDYQKMLCNLCSHLLRYGMPMQKLDPRPSFQVEARHARNAEEALLVLINLCAIQSERVSDIVWPTESSAGEWISRIRGQRVGSDSLPLAHLSYMNFSHCTLHIQDFYKAVLAYGVFDDAQVAYGQFTLASLASASFRRANMNSAIFVNADLTGANLTDAACREAKFDGCHLVGANLSGSHLEHASLKKADLRSANLHQVKMSEASFAEAKLDNAVLRNASATGAVFVGASLAGANLQGADLRGADFEGANLQGARLSGADLQGANLRRSRREGADFDGANLRATILEVTKPRRQR